MTRKNKILPGLVLLILSTMLASADSTIDPSKPFAYSANLGWMNFLPNQPSSPEGVTVCEYFCSGRAYSANAGWIDFGDGSPTNGIRYGNLNGNDAGVNHDGEGNLSGLAWGANIGWINFGWAGTNDPNRPRIDLFTGEFTGFAWGANIGWINLGSGQLVTQAIIYQHDTDNDGISDPWEREHVGNLTDLRKDRDFDGDGVTDKDEYCWATDPTQRNSSPQVLLNFNFNQNQVEASWWASAKRRYALEQSNDLFSWAATTGTFVKPTGLAFEVIPSPQLATEPRLFFRFVASKPLAP